MRAGTLLGLACGIGVLSWPALSHACPHMTRSEAIALLVWLLAMLGCLVSLLIAGVSWLAASVSTRSKIYRGLGLVNLIAWVFTLTAFRSQALHLEAVLLLCPSLVVGCGLWLLGSRGSRPRHGVTPGPV